MVNLSTIYKATVFCKFACVGNRLRTFSYHFSFRVSVSLYRLLLVRHVSVGPTVQGIIQ